MEATKKKSNFAWVVMISCCFIMFGVLGIVANSISLFMTAFSQQYTDQSMASLALYFTCMTGTMAIFQPVARKIFAKVDTRIVATVAILLACGGFALISAFTTFVGWMACGVIIGLGLSFLTYLLIPILINNWFKKSLGTVMGIAMACTNLGGAVFGTVMGNLIQSMGWSSAMRLGAVIAAVISLPFAILGLRYAPKGNQQAYGADEAAQKQGAAVSVENRGLTFKESLKTPWFWLVAIGVIVCFFACNFQTQAAKFATTAYAFDIAQAGVLSTCLMVGSIAGKVLLGMINDKFGVGTTYTVGACAMIAGILVLVTGSVATMAFIGAALFGFGFATMSIAPPLMVKGILGPKDYANIYGYIASVGTLTSMFSSNVYAAIFEGSGSYTGGMVAASIALVVGIAVVLIGLKNGKKSWK